MTYEEYTQVIEELKEINETQKTGDDDNTPSYTPPVVEPEAGQEQPTVKVDNNGDTGNARDDAAPINQEVPTPEVAHIAPPENVDTNDNDAGGEVVVPQEIDTSPGVEWAGPID